KTCVKCADGLIVIQEDITEAGVAYTADPYTCQACPDEHMYWTASGTCACRSGYTLAGTEAIGETYCLDDDRVATVATGWPLADAIELDYYSVQEVPGEAADGTVSLDSLTVQHHYLRAAAGCYAYRGPEDLAACQALANLCVLADYDREHTTCELFEEVADARSGSSWSQDGWTASLPWLYYADPRATVLADGASRWPRARRPRGKYHELTSCSRRAASAGPSSACAAGHELLLLRDGGAGHRQGGGTNSPTGFLKFGPRRRAGVRCDLETLIGQERSSSDPSWWTRAGLPLPGGGAQHESAGGRGAEQHAERQRGAGRRGGRRAHPALLPARRGLGRLGLQRGGRGLGRPGARGAALRQRAHAAGANPGRGPGADLPAAADGHLPRAQARQLGQRGRGLRGAAVRHGHLPGRVHHGHGRVLEGRDGVLRDLHRGLCGPDALAVAELPAAEHAAGRHGPGGQRADLQGRRALRGGHVPQLRGDLLPCHVLHLLLLVHVLQAPGHGVQHAAAQQPRVWGGQRVLRVYRRGELPLGVPLYLDGERHLPAVDRGHLLHRLGDALWAEGH
ncbi:unnamed protein product, partial [Heterosigma akashiwo]